MSTFSFIPAEEDSDEDFGEFFDDDIHLKNVPQKYTTATAVTNRSTNQNQNEKEDVTIMSPTPSNIALQAMNHNVQQHKTPVPWESLSSPRVTSIFTLEDYKRAVIKGNISVIEQCLNQDLPFDTPFKGGWTALMYAANHVQPDVLQLLIAQGANVNYHYEFFTPLMAACSASDLEKEENVTQCVKLLIATGVSVNAQDRQHATSLMLASREGHAEAVKVLIEHGAEVNKQDGRGWTALTWAAQRARKSVVELLLSSGADPKIQHRDQLTVTDLAASLPTNEILELLEQKSLHHELKTTSSNSPVDLSKPLPKCEDLKIFLLGLDLPHLVELFQQQLIDLSLLMTLTEQDLIQLGVEQLGARKKILNAINAVHKKDWQPSSLVSFHYHKKLSCADVIAVMANTSKHLSYICSTMRYIMGQLNKHPDIITQPTDQVSPVLLSRHIEDTQKNMKALNDQLLKLQIELNKEMKLRCSEPADLLQLKCFEQKRRKQLTRVTFILTICACLALPFYYHRNTLLSHLPTSAFSFFTTNG